MICSVAECGVADGRARRRTSAERHIAAKRVRNRQADDARASAIQVRAARERRAEQLAVLRAAPCVRGHDAVAKFGAAGQRDRIARDVGDDVERERCVVNDLVECDGWQILANRAAGALITNVGGVSNVATPPPFGTAGDHFVASDQLPSTSRIHDPLVCAWAIDDIATTDAAAADNNRLFLRARSIFSLSSERGTRAGRASEIRGKQRLIDHHAHAPRER